jgi:PTH1 family peptidyl-tRNA hydrolase
MDFQISQIKLIVGLGNVGSNYAQTRHNAGFMFVDLLSSQLDPRVNWQSNPKLSADIAKQHNFRLAKPTTMMNNSGSAVAAILKYFELTPSQLLVAHDDMDVPLGKTKLQFARGPVKHNGIDSIEKHLRTDQFWRLRIGIENREVKGNKGIPGMKYALERFAVQEREVLNQALDLTIPTFIVDPA